MKDTILILGFFIITTTVFSQTGISDVNFTPQSMLHVHINAASGNLLQLTNTTTGNGSSIVGFKLNYNGNDISFINNQAGFISFYTSNLERMRILSGGFVGIGTSVPGYKLDVQGGSLNVGTLYGTYVMYGTLGSFDTRATNPNPETYNMGVTSEFKQNTSNGLNDGGSFNSVLSVRQWSSGTDWSGGGVHQMGFTQNGEIWHRYSQTTGSWGPWTKFLTSANGGVTSSCGTVNYIPKMTSSSNIGCSQIFDNGTNVGIGTTGPGKKLDVQGMVSFGSGTYQSGAVVDIGNAGVDYPGNSGWAGSYNSNVLLSGLDYTSISFHDAGATVGELGHVSNYFFFDGGQAWGPVRLGINTRTPAYTLDINQGSFGFGSSNVRTETRNDAGLQGNAGAQSGFYETASPSNFPAGASSWWHLIDCRHSNNGNNYALQISGSFFDQKLYFRKTNNNAAQAWTEILSAANNPVSVSLASDYTVNTASWTTIAPMTVTFTATKSTAIVQFTCSGFAYTNSMSYVQFRIWNSTLGTSIGGTQTKMQSYDDTKGTITPWSCSFSKNITGLTPGTSYTLVVQAQRDGIWGTYDAVIYAASVPDGHHMTLTVFP